MKILIMGLSGSGKTTLARNLVKVLETANHTITYLNADSVRELSDDWDFSYDGRIRQAQRMVNYANESKNDYIIMDFICPLEETRNIVKADFTIWMDTIDKSVYHDTDALFEKPDNVNIKIDDFDYTIDDIVSKISYK